MRPIILFAAMSIILVSTTTQADTDNDNDEWQFALMPYLWLPVIEGTLKYKIPPGGNGSPNVEVGPTNWFDLLNYGLLLNGSARKGRYSIFSDIMLLSMTSKNDGQLISVGPGSGGLIPIDADLNINTRTDLDALAWTVVGGYTLQETESSVHNVFAGIRIFDVEVDTRWDLTADITTPGGMPVLPAQGSIGADIEILDGIVGVRGGFSLGEGNWSALYYLDVGAGDASLTWSAIAGVTYELDWGELVFAYRHLDYDQGSDDLLQDFSFSGLGIGGIFRL